MKKRKMKCPKQYYIVQGIREELKQNENGENRGFTRVFIENQSFKECYKEECAYWNKEKSRCGGID